MLGVQLANILTRRSSYPQGLKLSTHCFYTATATENDVASSYFDSCFCFCMFQFGYRAFCVLIAHL